MSNIVVCYKWVVDEADIRINSDMTVDTKRAKGKISDYDRNAIEAAVQSAKDLGMKPIGLTFGNSQTSQSLKDALSRGLEEVYFVKAGENDHIDGRTTAKVLAAAINKIGDVSVVICADGASDTYARQTASRIGAVLDLPVVTSIIDLKIEGNTLTAVRKMDDCFETVKVEMPVVISVIPEINTPTTPGLKAVMAAGKKKVIEFNAADLNVDLTPKSQVTDIKGYVMNRKNVILRDGEAADRVKELVVALRKEGVL